MRDARLRMNDEREKTGIRTLNNTDEYAHHFSAVNRQPAGPGQIQAGIFAFYGITVPVPSIGLAGLLAIACLSFSISAAAPIYFIHLAERFVPAAKDCGAGDESFRSPFGGCSICSPKLLYYRYQPRTG